MTASSGEARSVDQVKKSAVDNPVALTVYHWLKN